jgi:hypothetical protein
LLYYLIGIASQIFLFLDKMESQWARVDEEMTEKLETSARYTSPDKNYCHMFQQFFENPSNLPLYPLGACSL